MAGHGYSNLAKLLIWVVVQLLYFSSSSPELIQYEHLQVSSSLCQLYQIKKFLSIQSLVEEW